jgi:hypothetical protein
VGRAHAVEPGRVHDEIRPLMDYEGYAARAAAALGETASS